MSGKYSFLSDKIFEYGKAPIGTLVGFVKLDLEKQREFIRRIGGIPEELDEFYAALGEGMITQSVTGKPSDPASFWGFFMSPENIWKTAINFHEEPQYTKYDTRRALPFYKVDQGRYFHFKKKSNGDFMPGIYNPSGLKLSNNLEEFVRRCYYEDATFWLHCHGQVKFRTKNRKVVRRNV